MDKISPLYRCARGLSLIEVMVGLALALTASLIIVQVFSVTDGYRRTTTGAGSALHQASVLGYSLNNSVTTAGAGFAYSQKIFTGLAGCNLSHTPPASNTAWTALPTNLRLMPVAIISGGTSAGRPAPDILAIMRGNSSANNVATQVDISAGNLSTLVLRNALAFQPNDFLVAFNRPSANPPPVAPGVTHYGAQSCQFIRIANTYAPGANDATTQANFGGAALNAVINTATPIDPATPLTLSASPEPIYVAHIGSQPSFSLYGVDTNASRLRQYDLVASTDNIIADNIVTLQALYGVSATPQADDREIAAWVAPDAAFSYSNLNATVAGQNLIERIRAVRIAVVTRGANRLSGQQSPATLRLFGDLGNTLAINFALTAAERAFPMQVHEYVMQLRNSHVDE